VFEKILIANRGEIAVRVMRTCREMGIRTVAVYSDADTDALHVRLADEAYRIGPTEAAKSYLDMEAILNVAAQAHVDAIHPGYGFLSENPAFVELCTSRGIAFIGPSCTCMSRAKPKDKARRIAKAINIPVVPGSEGAIMCDEKGIGINRALEIAQAIGYPVIVKPSGGGGGIGMKIAESRTELMSAIRHATARGKKAFGLSSFYIEKYLPGVKHVEIQVIADTHGNIVHMGDRDCSIQRRFQKLIEEAPCPALTLLMRMKMGRAAIKLAGALHCDSLMTVEFLYAPQTQQFFFNEVNCRLQVEHSITELATGIDMVKEQIRIGAGEQLGFSQDHVRFQAHAMECRITAEDYRNNFLPSPGTIDHLHLPHGLGVRVDEGVDEGAEISLSYDSMIFKLITWGNTRDEALSRMRRALAETSIEGVTTTLQFHRQAIETIDFAGGNYTTDFVPKVLAHTPGSPPDAFVTRFYPTDSFNHRVVNGPL
jgi:pyruvate carboxylase subunit A